MSVLSLTSHGVVRLGPHGVKGLRRYTAPPDWLGDFFWQVRAIHPCSGVAPFISSQQWSHSDYIVDPFYEIVTTPWTSFISTVIDWQIRMGLDASALTFDYRDPAVRYLVQTYTVRIESAGNFGGKLLRRTLKLHKHVNDVWWIDLEKSDNDGVNWSSLFHWDIGDDGTVTTSGTDLDGYVGIWAWYDDIVGDGPGDGYIPANSIGSVPHDRNATTGEISASSTQDFIYVDYLNNVLLTVNLQTTYSMSNDYDAPWSVDLAKAACSEMSALINLYTIFARYPLAGGGTEPFSGGAFPIAQVAELTWSRSGVDGSVGVQCGVSSEGEGSMKIIAENWLWADVGFAGTVTQVKTLINLAAGTYTKRTITEGLPAAATNAPPTTMPVFMPCLLLRLLKASS